MPGLHMLEGANMFAEVPSRALLQVLRRLLIIITVIFLGGLCCATLVRFSPGFGIDERELDSRLNQDSVQAIRLSHSGEQSVAGFYWDYMRGLVHGQLGTSHEFGRPITELIRERSGVSLRSLAYALPSAWALAFFLAAILAAARKRWAAVLASLAAGGLLAVPIAMVALFAVSTGTGTSLALSVVLAPVFFRYAQNILERSFRKPYILAARSQGIGTTRLLFCHVLPNAAPQLIGLAGVSVSMAFGALIPVEAICDSPGIGHLALQAALARDLPLLVGLTLIITVVTLTANMTTDVVRGSLIPKSA